jgi:hypothetical protein
MMPTQQRRNRLRGKQAERAVAKMLGGRRMGLFGKEDVEHKFLSVEVKSRVSFVGKGWMQQAERNNPKPVDKIPVVVIHTKNCDHKNDLVMLRIADFQRFLKHYTSYGIHKGGSEEDAS